MSAPRVHRLERTASTNDDARRLACEGAPHGTAVVAEHQSAGRGRLGRQWLGASGAVALSIVVRPTLPAASVPLVCLAAAVATAGCCGPAWRIKWPNDIVDPSGRGKVAGILAEAEWAGGAPAFVVLGIGVNLTAAPPDVNAAALSDLGAPPDREAFIGALIEETVRRVDQLVREGPAPVLGAWRQRAVTLGRRVQVGEIVGIAVDIDDSGALLLRGDDGAERRILAGDVQMVAPRHS